MLGGYIKPALPPRRSLLILLSLSYILHPPFSFRLLACAILYILSSYSSRFTFTCSSIDYLSIYHMVPDYYRIIKVLIINIFSPSDCRLYIYIIVAGIWRSLGENDLSLDCRRHDCLRCLWFWKRLEENSWYDTYGFLWSQASYLHVLESEIHIDPNGM